MRRRARMAWHNLGLRARVGVVALAVVFTVLVALFVLKWAPEWLAADDLSGKDKAEDVGRKSTALLAILAGSIAVAGAIFTGLSYRLNRAGQITERFTRAIDQLGDAKVEIRLGGIYALERIARDSRDDHPQVVEVFTAFVREHARYPPNDSRAATTSSERGQGDEAAQPDEAETPRLAAGVQAVMDVLARRDVSQDQPDHRLKLDRTDLRRLVLDAKEGGRLGKANLAGAHLEGADLEGVYLDGADLGQAHLEGANLGRAHLEGANLGRAHLEGANLGRAHLEGANLGGAHYDDATTWPTKEFDPESQGRAPRR